MGANGVLMNSRIRVIILVAVLGMPCLASGAALASTDPPGGHLRTIAQGSRGAPQQGSWATAQQVPGTAALNKGHFAQVLSVSCASAGNCSAGGTYKRSGAQAFVVSEVNGTWGTAIEVPGTAALNTGGHALTASVSCASAGNCSGGGYYLNSSHQHQAFVVSQVNGTWGTAVAVPGITALNRHGISTITSVSCVSAGNCSAGGYYSGGTRFSSQAFVVSQADGTWSDAMEVPGTAALNTGLAQIASVSCVSAGNCSAGGYYTDSSGDTQAFVVSQASGTWGTAIEVPGTATQGDNAAVTSVSCGSAGNCSAGGYYQETVGFGQAQAFVVSEVSGTWGTAVEVPGTAALNTGGIAEVLSVSCASAGNCSAGGFYDSSTGPIQYQPFVVSEVSGTWGTAVEVPGTAALNTGGYGSVYSVSCTSAGDCSAGGDYENSSYASQAFVVSEVSGTWGTAIEVPGTAALNTGGGANVNSVSCAAAGNCSAGGYYAVLSTKQDLQAFVDSQS
jgi:hypothetical protein